jgi:hypothetical protein
MLLVEIYQIYPIIHAISLDIVGIPMALAFPHYTYIYIYPLKLYIYNYYVYIYIPLHFYWKYRPTGWCTKWDVNYRLSLQLHIMLYDMLLYCYILLLIDY